MFELFRRLFWLPEGASSIADGIDTLHAFVIGLMLLMAIYVFGTATWFTLRYRRKTRDQLTERVVSSRLPNVS